jgi:hypothetical protein
MRQQSMQIWATKYLRDKAVWIETTGGTHDPFVLG